MSSTQSRFADKKYRNWLEGTLSLLYVKEGIENIIETEAEQFHKTLLKNLNGQGTTQKICSSCTSLCMKKDFRRRVWKMQCGFCNAWLQQIVQHHSYSPFPNLNPDNTNPQLWPTGPFEVFKAYMHYGCAGNQSAKDGDVQGVLSLLKNCRHFTTCGRIGQIQLIDELLEFRNSLFHSGNLLVDDAALQAAQQTMFDFLRGMTSLSTLEQHSVVQAVNKIKELQTGTLDLSLNLGLELQALQMKQNAIDSAMKCLKQELDTTSKKAGTTEDDLQTLQSGFVISNAEHSKLESDLNTQTDKMTDVEQRLEKLQVVQDSFNRFLQANNLEQDMARLSSAIEHLTATDNKQEGDIATLYQRQHAIELEQQERLRDSQVLRNMLVTQHSRLENVETRINYQAGSENKEVSEDDIKVLQAFLRKYYRTLRLKIPNPVVSEELRLDCLYVDPDIKVLRETTDPGRGLVNVQDQPMPANTSQCRQLFYTKDYKCKQIYITGDAGLGKSIFCKHLVDLWCKADGEIMGEDMQIMSEFKLLFYIILRESPNQYRVEDMIDSQILRQDEAHQYPRASVLLTKIPCLVIIDGLDEWVCPPDDEIPLVVKRGIPGRNWMNTSNVFLTTTRSWKFDVLQLTSSEVDKHVDLIGLNNIASETLCTKIIKLLESNERANKTEGNFQTALKEKKLINLSKIPVILTQLICLWFDKQDLGKSQVQLYCSMLEMLLERPDKNLPEQTCPSTPDSVSKDRLLPECFSSNHRHCQTHQHLLKILGKVAFDALFNQNREHALVFKSYQMDILGVDQTDVELCLKSGILSQSKVLGRWSVNEKTLSFLHKKLQEFLAAIFITTCENTESVKSHVKQFCTTVESMLEMSQVWMYVSGIRPDLATQLLTELMTDVVVKDTRLQQYRQTLIKEYVDSSALARSIQTCIVECVIEAKSNGQLDLCLPLVDFVINQSTKSASLESLLALKNTDIHSFYIYNYDLTSDEVERAFCHLKDTRCLEKLYMHKPHSVITNMQPLCQTLVHNKNNLKSLEIHYLTLTKESSAAVTGALNNITALNLYFVRLTHEQMEKLLSSVSQARNIRQLRLYLMCTDHPLQCRAGIDVSGHTQLNTLDLSYMYVEHVPAMTPYMKYVELSFVTIAEGDLRQFIHTLSATSHKVTVDLGNVTVTNDSEKPVDLTDLAHNHMLAVTRCQFHDRINTWTIAFYTKQQMAIE